MIEHVRKLEKGDTMKNATSEARRWSWILTTLAMVVMPAAIETRADDVSDVAVKIERVALFKNGLGYFTASATLPKGATTVRLGQLPVPSHGTFWVGYPKDVELRSLFTSMEDVEASLPARSVAELVRANLGRKVTISMGSKDEPAITGTIVQVLSEEKPQPPSPYLMEIRRSPTARRYEPYRVPLVVVIRTETGSVALRAGTITRAEFEGDDITTSVSVVSKQPSIRMKLAKPTNGQAIEVSYLARGITWSPSYMIDISDPTTARLRAKAVVVNEVADLHDVHVDLVTGFPNIRFGDVSSPVAMTQNLEGFLNALTTGRSESRGRGVMMQQQAVMSNVARFGNRDDSAVMPGYATAREGTVSEDLFLYPVEHLTLAREETAWIPLFTAEVPYEHIYIWKIPDLLDEHERYRRERERDEQLFAEAVWHACRLVNNMNMPWTTAPAEFVKDGQVTGQDICYYTAPGAETTIRINRAMNVMAEEAELELARKRNATTYHGVRYDLVTVNGELKLENRVDKTATVEVTKNLSGEVLETAPQAKDIPTAKGLKRVNPRHVLVWKIDMKPGEKRTLSYTYEVYVRN